MARCTYATSSKARNAMAFAARHARSERRSLYIENGDFANVLTALPSCGCCAAVSLCISGNWLLCCVAARGSALPEPGGFCIFGGLLFRPVKSQALGPAPHGKRPSARDGNRSGRLRRGRLCGRLGRSSFRRGTPTRGSGLFLGCFFLSRLFSRLFFGCRSPRPLLSRRFARAFAPGPPARLLFARRAGIPCGFSAAGLFGFSH